MKRTDGGRIGRRAVLATLGVAALAAGLAQAPGAARAGPRGARGLGRAPALGCRQLADHPVHDRQPAVRAACARARLRPHGRLPRLSVGDAAGRGLRRRQPRFRHVGQHADHPRHRPAAAMDRAQRRRRAFPLHHRDPAGFRHPQRPGPQGQDDRRAVRRRSLQRALADPARRARLGRPARARHQHRQHAVGRAGGDRAAGRGRRDHHLAALPHGAARGRHGRHRQLLRLHRGPLQGPGRRGRRASAGIGQGSRSSIRTATTCTARSGSCRTA